MNPSNDHTALAPPLCPELMQRHFEAECAFNAALAQFQAAVQPVSSFSLPAVLEAARPAFSNGFCYLIRELSGEMVEVSLRHKDGAEEVSTAPLDTAAPGLLLAELLGIPVLTGGQAAEPEPKPVQVATVRDVEPAPAEPADEPDLIGPDSPADIPADDPCLTPLDEQQITTAVAMIKAMDPVARKAFQIAFRNAFDLDRNVRQITPHITQLRHLEFIDRFTIEAAGGIAA